MASTVPDEVAMDMADLLMVAVDTTIVNREEGDNTTGSSLADEEDRRRLLLDMLLQLMLPLTLMVLQLRNLMVLHQLIMTTMEMRLLVLSSPMVPLLLLMTHMVLLQ